MIKILKIIIILTAASPTFIVKTWADTSPSEDPCAPAKLPDCTSIQLCKKSFDDRSCKKCFGGKLICIDDINCLAAKSAQNQINENIYMECQKETARQKAQCEATKLEIEKLNVKRQSTCGIDVYNSGQ